MNLDRAIYDTIRYYALFDMPVTAVQIWRSLIVVGQSAARLDHIRYHDIRHVLATSAWLHERIEKQWGYYFLSGQQEAIERRLQRYLLAQHKWRAAKRAAKFLALVPFVQALFGSGSLALYNTRPESDLDVFVVARAGRIWTARLGLLFVSQLLGRRRTHWEAQAPDKICLNHHITDADVVMPPAVRNVFTAVAYTHLVPLFNHNLLAEFEDMNWQWVQQYLVTPPTFSLRHRQAITLGRLRLWLKKQLEAFLQEPVGDWLEKQARYLQLRAIARHSQPGQAGRIVATDRELAFHPDTRVPALLKKFQGQ